MTRPTTSRPRLTVDGERSSSRACPLFDGRWPRKASAMRSAEADALETQLGELVSLVDDLSDEDFRRPTRCPGWSVAELVAHCEGMLLRLVGENAKAVDGEAEIDRVGYYRYDPEGPREGDSSGKTFSEVVRDRVIDEVGGR